MCQISLALNRVYTEWYTHQGYNFNITNSTWVDQNYIHGRNIFDSVAIIVDKIFNHYIRRQGFKEPYYAEYCDGIKATCAGLKQWGTVELAKQGYAPLDILKYYYPKDIEIVVSDRFSEIYESYPGYALRIGSSGEYVQAKQLFLNRISGDFPNIPKIANPNGIFGADTQAAVTAFQRQFGLTPDGIIGRSTWNQISRIYTAVKKMAQLVSEGERIGIGKTPPTATIRQGARGENVVLLQFLLNAISDFYPEVPPVPQTGVFDANTLASVKAFQRQMNLSIDGIVGSGTWRALYDVYKGIVGSVPVPPSNVDDYPGSPLRSGSTGSSVKILQNYLNAISDVFPAIPKVTVDGIFGPGTLTAVRTYQSLFGLTVDGVVGPSSWNSIVAQFHLLNKDAFPGVALRIGSRGEEVLKMQKYLNSIRNRYPTIPRLTEDGIYGNGTAAAVREFQRIFGLTQDGVIGMNTWAKIIQQYNNVAPIGTVAMEYIKSSNDIITVQEYLNTLAREYSTPLVKVDGDFGANTQKAVKEFQSLFGLEANGVVGEETWNALRDAYWNITNRGAIISSFGKVLVSKMLMG